MVNEWEQRLRTEVAEKLRLSEDMWYSIYEDEYCDCDCDTVFLSVWVLENDIDFIDVSLGYYGSLVSARRGDEEQIAETLGFVKSTDEVLHLVQRLIDNPSKEVAEELLNSAGEIQ